MIVSMTAYNRPHYLEEVVETLKVAVRGLKADGEDTLLVASVEPSEVQDEILRLLADSCPLHWIVLNDERLKLQRNTFQALDHAFKSRLIEDDFVLHMEDDLVIAPDGLRMAAWMRDEYANDPNVTFVGLTTILRPAQPDSWNRVFRTGWFDCHIWGTWRSVWEEHMVPDWPDWEDHWAAFVNDHEMWGGVQVLPCLARSKSIGHFGTHSNDYYHQRHNPELYGGDVEIPRGAYFEDGDWPNGAEPWRG